MFKARGIKVGPQTTRELSTKNTIVNDSFHYNSNISKIAKKTYLMNNNLISSDNVPLFKEESNFYSSNISLANKIENTFDVKINDNFNLVSQNNKEEYKKANETIIIEPEDYQIKEEESMRLIEKVDNDFPTVLKASDDELLYENLHKEVNYSGDQISKLYKREGLFDITITNNYKKENLLLQMNEILNTCYPFLFDKI